MTDERELSMFTIFESPLDYPGKYVAREFFIQRDGPVPAAKPLAVVDSLDEARAAIPPGMYRMYRDPQDHVSVVETWI